MGISRSYIRAIDSDRYKNLKKKKRKENYGDENRQLFSCLEEKSSKNMSFYINTPKKLSNTILQEDYCELIIKNLKKYRSCSYVQNSEFSSVYFAGDNNFLNSHQFRRIMTYINENFTLIRPEICLELEAEKIDPKAIEDFYAMGFNKLILNVGTFDDKKREEFKKTCPGDALLNKINTCIDQGFKNSYIILSYNYEGFEKEILFEDMEKINSLDIAGFILNDKKSLARNDIRLRESFAIISNTARNVCYDFSKFNQMSRAKRDSRKFQKNIMHQNDILPIGLEAFGQVSDHLIVNPSTSEKLEKMLVENTCIFKMSESYKRLRKSNAMLDELFYDPKDLAMEDEKNLKQVLEDLACENFFQVKDEKLKLTDKGIYRIESIKEELSSLLV
jgi:coproporphyrinogen III oxidase-like Fe-S oxidoreductase